MPFNSRYVVVPRSIKAEDEWWPEVRETLDVIVEDGQPIDTGLVNEHGDKIMCVPAAHPVGFAR